MNGLLLLTVALEARNKPTLLRQRKFTKVITMTKKTTTFDAAEYLDTPEVIAEYLKEAFATGNQQFIAHSFGVVAKAKGMTALAKDTGLSREQLYKSFSEQGNPTLKTMLAVMHSFGVELSAKEVVAA